MTLFRSNKFFTASLLALCALVLTGFGSCQPRALDDSEMALTAGQATMVFSGCTKPIAMGYDVCQLARGQKLPKLELGFINPAEWAVSDCSGGFYKSGSVQQPGIVEVDLSGLQAQADRMGVCWLRLEATERYPHDQDGRQLASYAVAGGFIIEFLAPGYNPVPSQNVTGWCAQINRTSKGRTTVEKCRSSTR